MPLKIESIETIPIRVPLPFTYKGSYYKMRNRCTIITRIRTTYRCCSGRWPRRTAPRSVPERGMLVGPATSVSAESPLGKAS